MSTYIPSHVIAVIILGVIAGILLITLLTIIYLKKFHHKVKAYIVQKRASKNQNNINI